MLSFHKKYITLTNGLSFKNPYNCIAIKLDTTLIDNFLKFLFLSSCFLKFNPITLSNEF